MVSSVSAESMKEDRAVDRCGRMHDFIFVSLDTVEGRFVEEEGVNGCHGELLTSNTTERRNEAGP